MKNKIISLIVLILVSFVVKAQEDKQYNDSQEYEKGQILYLFGDNVIMRAAPKVEAEEITRLPIGTPVMFLENALYTQSYGGFEYPFYKVQVDGVQGYILSAFIAFEKLEKNGNSLLFVFRKTGEYSNNLLIRVLKDNTTYRNYYVVLPTSYIGLKLLDNKGLQNVDYILYVDYLSEACGIDGGGVYFLGKEDYLYDFFHITEVADSGMFANIEKLIFPTDEGGIEGKIIYERELYQEMNPEYEWTQTTKERCVMTWDGEKLTPDVRQALMELTIEEE